MLILHKFLLYKKNCILRWISNFCIFIKHVWFLLPCRQFPEESKKSRSKRGNKRASTSSIESHPASKTSKLTESSESTRPRRNSLDSVGSSSASSSTRLSFRRQSVELPLEPYAISQNLRSNTNASVIDGIPYYKTKEKPKETKRASPKSFEHSAPAKKQKTKNNKEEKNKTNPDSNKSVIVDSNKVTKTAAKSLTPGKKVHTPVSGESSTGGRRRKSFPSKSPELDSLRRTRQSRKTGSCASSRYDHLCNLISAQRLIYTTGN